MSLVKSVAQFAQMAREVMSLRSDEILALDTETSGLRLYQDDVLRGVSLAYRDQSAYVPISHHGSWNLPQQYHGAFRDLLQNVWAEQGYWNAKFDFHALERGLGVRPPERYVDGMVLRWLQDENAPKALKVVAAEVFGADAAEEQRALKAIMKGETQAEAYKRLRQALRETGEKEPAATTKQRAKIEAVPPRGWADLTAEEIHRYAETDTVLTKRLIEHLRCTPEYAKIEPAIDTHLRLIRVVQRMEKRGIGVDLAKVHAGRERNLKRMAEIEAEPTLAGTNLASPAQLGTLIYEEWGLPVHERTDTGAPSTSRAALEALEGAHEGLDLILEYRRLSKAVSAYYDSLIARTDPEGRVHASFNTCGTVSGRLSCNSPNLQQTPRSDTDPYVRECFVPAEGFELWSYDLRSAELFVAASLARDKDMMAALSEEGRSFHRETAKAVFGTDEGRYYTLAKNLNYGIPYGIGPTKFAKYLVTGSGEPVGPKHVAQAKAAIDKHREQWPALHRCIRLLADHAEATGRVPLHAPGRFRHFQSPTLQWPVPSYHAFNFVVQGGVASFMVDMLISVEPRLDKLGARQLLQVHDSLVVEVPIGKAEQVHKVIQTTADRINPFAMRMIFDAKSGV